MFPIYSTDAELRQIRAALPDRYLDPAHLNACRMFIRALTKKTTGTPVTTVDEWSEAMSNFFRDQLENPKIETFEVAAAAAMEGVKFTDRPLMKMAKGGKLIGVLLKGNWLFPVLAPELQARKSQLP